MRSILIETESAIKILLRECRVQRIRLVLQLISSDLQLLDSFTECAHSFDHLLLILNVVNVRQSPRLKSLLKVLISLSFLTSQLLNFRVDFIDPLRDLFLILLSTLESVISFNDITQFVLHILEVFAEALQLDSSSLNTQGNLAVIHVTLHILDLSSLLAERSTELLHVNRQLFEIVNFLFERDDVLRASLQHLLASLNLLILRVELLDELADVGFDLMQ